MKYQSLLVVCLILTLAISSGSELISDSINSFAGKLYDVLATDSAAEDMVFSPFSAHSALSLAYLGSANKTADSFERALDLPDMNETLWGYRNIMAALKTVEKVSVSTANKIYVMTDFELKEEFRSVAEHYFSANVENINFAESAEAATVMNHWCKNITRNKIDRMVKAGDLSEDTRAIILNAVYFKGNWLHKFNKEVSRVTKFYTSERDSTDCEMMFQIGRFEYGTDESLDCKILKMRYEDERFSMIVILPNRIDGLRELEESLRYRNLTSFALDSVDVEVDLPKFKIASTLDLYQPLSKLGLEEMFTFSADFSNLLKSSRAYLKVDKVVQKAFIEVNEQGSEAAAATVVEITSRLGTENEIFVADHPFLFYITAQLEADNDADTILFMGRVSRPTTTRSHTSER